MAFAPLEGETTNEPSVVVEADEPIEDTGLMDELFQLLDAASTQTKLDAINSSATDSETKQSLVARYLHQRWPLTGETTTPFKEEVDEENEEQRNYYEEHLEMAWEELKRGDVPVGNEPSSTAPGKHQRKNKSTVATAASPKHILLPRQKKNVQTTPATTPSFPAPLSNVSTMSLKERTERMIALAAPIIDRSTSRPKPPALSTSCPDLSVHVVEDLQAQDTLPVRSWHRKATLSTVDTRRRPSAFASLATSLSDKRPSSSDHTRGGASGMTMDGETVTAPEKQNSAELIRLPLSADRLRITITAEVDEMWRKVHKGAFRARAYTRNDTTRSGHLWEPGALIDPAELRKQFSDQSASSNQHSSTSNGTSSSSSSSGGTVSGTTLPGGEEDDIHATSSEATNSKDQMRQFFGSFRLEFICLVLDVHMQVLGTYDVSLRKYIPGLDLGPDFLRRATQHHSQQQPSPLKQKDEQYYNHANVLEINFNELPKQVFAIVPMFLDESNVSRKELIKEAIVKAKQFQDFSFRLDMFCHARPPESYKDHIDTLFENEAELKEKKIRWASVDGEGDI